MVGRLWYEAGGYMSRPLIHWARLATSLVVVVVCALSVVPLAAAEQAS